MCIKKNIGDNNNNGIIIPNSQKISPNLSFWSNNSIDLNKNKFIPMKKRVNLPFKNGIENHNNSSNSFIIKGKNINKFSGVSPNLSFWESNENKNNNIHINDNNDKPILYKNNFNENNKIIYNNTQIKNNDKSKNNKCKSSYVNGVFPKVNFWPKNKDENLIKSYNNIVHIEDNTQQSFGLYKKDNNDIKINNLRKPNKNNESFVIIRNHIFN